MTDAGSINDQLIIPIVHIMLWNTGHFWSILIIHTILWNLRHSWTIPRRLIVSQVLIDPLIKLNRPINVMDKEQRGKKNPQSQALGRCYSRCRPCIQRRMRFATNRTYLLVHSNNKCSSQKRTNLLIHHKERTWERFIYSDQLIKLALKALIQAQEIS